jgi:chromosome segregation ATPase
MNMATIDAAFITAIFGGVGVLIGAWAAARRAAAEARKIEAEAHRVDKDGDTAALHASNETVKLVQAEVERLRLRIEVLEGQIVTERANFSEVASKYQQALSRIVDLETEVTRHQRLLAEARLELAKLREGMKTKEAT